jgi:septation ring formation regulator EzrA
MVGLTRIVCNQKERGGSYELLHAYFKGRYANREGRISIPVIDEDMSKIKEHMHEISRRVSSIKREVNITRNEVYYVNRHIKIDMEEINSSMDAIKKLVQNDAT